jgi:hypothetical protein
VFVGVAEGRKGLEARSRLDPIVLVDPALLLDSLKISNSPAAPGIERLAAP